MGGEGAPRCAPHPHPLPPVPQELLEEVRRELHKMKEEIIEGGEGAQRGKLGGGDSDNDPPSPFLCPPPPAFITELRKRNGP